MNKQALNIELNRLIKKYNFKTDLAVNDYIIKLIRLYKASLKDINNLIESTFIKYGDNVSLGQLYNNNRLLNLQTDIKEVLKDLGISTKDLITDNLKDVYKLNEYKVTTFIDKKLKLDFGLLNEKTINTSILNDLALVKWKTISDTNILTLNNNINETITTGLIKGTGYKKVAKEVTNAYNVTASKSNRIVRTESHKVQSLTKEEDHKALNNRLKESGLAIITKRIWHASLDSRGRHGFMNNVETNDNDMFNFKGMEVSSPGLTGIASEDINCRCSTSIKIIKGN